MTFLMFLINFLDLCKGRWEERMMVQVEVQELLLWVHGMLDPDHLSLKELFLCCCRAVRAR